jgi:NADH-quinone oxidoreductase subunit C
MSNEKNLFEKLSGKFGNKIMNTTLSFGEPVVTIEKDVTREVLSFLRDDKEGSFDMLVDLFGVDYPGEEPRFEIVYILRSTKSNGRVTVKTRAGEDGLDTMSDLWKSSDWLEREIYDMFGVKFKNHPDLRRIYTDDDFNGHPLRKDFPLQGHDFDKSFIVKLQEDKA